jgi:hypothetical protein
MNYNSLIKRIDKILLSFINTLTANWKDDHDIQLLYNLLEGKLENFKNTMLTVKIGSDKRINHKILNETINTNFYNEFMVQIRANSTSFHVMATIFHSNQLEPEGISYYLDSTTNSGLATHSHLLLTETEGRNTQDFFSEILLLQKLNREIRIESIINPLSKS